MALTADHLVVIGRGRVLADCSMADFIADHAASYVRCAARSAGEVADVLLRQGLDVAVQEDGEPACRPSTPPRSASSSARTASTSTRLTVRSSLEDAFMTLTADSVEYHAATLQDHPMTTRRASAPSTSTRTERPGRPEARLPGHDPGRVDQVLDRAVDAVVGGHAVPHGRGLTVLVCWAAGDLGEREAGEAAAAFVTWA